MLERVFTLHFGFGFEHRFAREHDVVSALRILRDEKGKALSDELAQARAVMHRDVRSGCERAEPVDVDFDAAFDDARDESFDGGFFAERFRDFHFVFSPATRMTREHDEPAASAVVRNHADEIRAHLEHDRRKRDDDRRVREAHAFGR